MSVLTVEVNELEVAVKIMAVDEHQDFYELVATVYLHRSAPEPRAMCRRCGSRENVYAYVNITVPEAPTDDYECGACVIRAASGDLGDSPVLSNAAYMIRTCE